MSHNPANPHATPTAGGHLMGDRHTTVTPPALPRRATRFWQARWFRSEWMRDLISFQVSAIMHCVLMIILALFLIAPEEPRGVAIMIAPAHDSDGPPELIDLSADTSFMDADQDSVTSEQEQSSAVAEPIEIPSPFATSAAGGLPAHSRELVEAVPSEDWLLVSEAPVGGGFQGRTQQQRARLAASRGGNAESENAVELGLAWLAAHQRQDGSWQLDHQKGPCDGRCDHTAQKLETSIGATGLALLPFLGAGYTHQQGPYREVIGDGLDFLLQQMKTSERGGDLQWDTTVGMYAQGIATLALCEAYAMSGDLELEAPAQQAIDFISQAQHKRGGWRYLPGQPGDTTVTGWQVMALKSARMARLHVPSPVFERAKLFLNTVQDGGGAFYGYLNSEKEPATTSVGLLLRMYLGWTRQDERLGRGALYLSNRGPSQNDMYYNYYATQVLHHFEEPYWEPWNTELRDFLVRTQETQGHARGSWFFTDPHGSVGGRHYTTAICTMILEVYYRHMPLYGERAVDEEW